MKLATFRTSDRVTHAGVVHDEWVIELDYPTVLELLRDPEGLARARGTLESWSVGARFIAPTGEREANWAPAPGMLPGFDEIATVG